MAHDFKLFPELTNSQMQIYYFQSPHQQITEDFFAKVVKVTDGDTIRVKTDFRNFDFPIRLANINAPELSEGGQESKLWLKKLIEGKLVEILLSKVRVEKWGRLLAEVEFEGINVGDMSLDFGYSILFEDINKLWGDFENSIKPF